MWPASAVCVLLGLLGIMWSRGGVDSATSRA
jgi:hypothetical protein